MVTSSTQSLHHYDASLCYYITSHHITTLHCTITHHTSTPHFHTTSHFNHHSSRKHHSNTTTSTSLQHHFNITPNTTTSHLTITPNTTLPQSSGALTVAVMRNFADISPVTQCSNGFRGRGRERAGGEGKEGMERRKMERRIRRV